MIKFFQLFYNVRLFFIKFYCIVYFIENENKQVYVLPLNFIAIAIGSEVVFMVEFITYLVLTLYISIILNITLIAVILMILANKE